jgi:hypothetical protein
MQPGEVIMKNMRMSRRVQVNFPVAFDLEGERIEGTARELGDGGLRFECHAELEPSSRGLFSLSASTDEPPMTIKGEILYRYESLPGGTLFQYGVRFTGMDDDIKESVAKILRLVTLKERYAPKRCGMIEGE